MRCKVRSASDENYEVVELEEDDQRACWEIYPVFEGSLADCEAYIRLSEGRYL